MPHTFYQQCLLRKQGNQKTRLLPSKYAIVGRVVKLKRADGAWDEGWRVESVTGDLIPPSQAAKGRVRLARDGQRRDVAVVPHAAPESSLSRAGHAASRAGCAASDCPPPPRAIA